MFSTILNVQGKPDSADQMKAFVVDVLDRLAEVPGIRAFQSIDRGEDKYLIVVTYDTKEDWENAATVSRELLSKIADLMAAPPEREGAEVIAFRAY